MSNFIRSLFGSKKSPSKIKPRMQSRRLELVGLEERVTPAVVASFSGNALTLLSDSNDTFSVSSDANGVISITGTSVTAGDANVTVVAGSTSTVTVNSLAGGAAAVQVLALTGDNAAETQDITLTNINSTAFNTNFGISFNVQGGDDIIRFGGSINLNGTGTLIADSTGGVDAIVLGQGSDLTLTSVSGAITIAPDGSGATNVITLSNNVTINSTSGNVTLGDDVVGAGKNLSINSGSGTVTAIRTLGDTTALGNLTITSTNATSSAISLAAVTSGDVILTGTGDVSVSGVVAVTSINTKSTAGDVIFGNTVTTSAVGGFTSEATLATKATKIADTVNVLAGANALVTGNLVTSSAISNITVDGTGTINITGKVDAATANNNLALEALNGAITIGGAVGSSAVAMGQLFADGNTSFSANGPVTVGNLGIGILAPSPFATSINFAEAVKVTAANYTLFVPRSSLTVKALSTGTITFAKTIELTNANADIDLLSANGNITVTGNITGKDNVKITTSGSGAITLSGAISNDTAGGDIFIQSGTGNVVTSGAISTSGATADIEIDTATSGNITIGGNVSTSGGGDIFLGADSVTAASGTGNLTINGTVTTNGTAAGDIVLGIAGGTGTVNKAVTAGATGNVLFLNNLATDAYTIVSGANISAGNAVIDAFTSGGSAGIINLGANITALNDTGPVLSFTGIALDNSINLTGAVSMKAAGPGGGISLASVDGFQNLTLEATGTIILTSVGQTTPLNTVTVTNSNGVIAGTDSTNTIVGSFNAANVVLSDTTGNISFNKSTVITASLTTAAEFYTVGFGGTTVLSGAPVFLNTAGVNFTGTTSLTSGATITGNATSTVTLGGTIVSGGAFNIGAAGNTGVVTIADGTQLILNSAVASTIANPIAITGAGPGTLGLLGTGTLTLSADSLTGTTGASISVINGTLNVTGKIANATTATNGTITGAGGTIGNLTVATGTVAPGGTLNTAAVTLNAATNYSAAVLSTTTASNLKTASAINLGGATLSLPSVAAGLGVGDTFTIINNTAVSGLVTGTFANQPEGSSISALDALGNTVTFAVSYVGGTGNDVTLTVTNVSIANPSAIPQPMVAGQPLFNFFTAVGADAGGGPMVTVTLDILPGLTTVPTYFSFFAYDQGFTGGVRVAVNDLDGNDDTLEIITGAGAGGGPNVRVFQFNILTLTFNPTPIASFFAFNEPSFDGGIYVAGGDVTGDGIGDLLVGAGESGGPRVQVYAGSLNGVITSSPISDFFAYSTAFTGGVVVAAGDRTGDNTLEVITGPASNGGYNIKSFNVAGTGNNPTLIENFFAFNDFTSIGGLSIATAIFDANPLDDLVIGTTNTQFGVILNQDYEGIQANPFPGFTGAIRAGFADSSNSGVYQAVAAAGPGGGPVISAFSVDPINLTLSQTDSLFVLDPEFTGGLFVVN